VTLDRFGAFVCVRAQCCALRGVELGRHDNREVEQGGNGWHGTWIFFDNRTRQRCSTLAQRLTRKDIVEHRDVIRLHKRGVRLWPLVLEALLRRL
jgi:hypothetical protein